jgi:NDP-sugar pyrophosphorylase family protein
MIPALVLTAGLATRLQPLSFVRAKAALPIAGEPLVRRILRWLRSNQVSEAVLNLHHLPHTITSVVGDGSDLEIPVRYSWENPVLGSAGGPKRALTLLHSPRFLIVNGDTLTDLDLGQVVAAHDRSGALVTMAVVANTEPHKYSGLAVEDGHVTGVVPRGSSQPSYHFFGVQVVEAEAFSTVPEGVPYETVRQLYPALMAERPGSVRAFHASAEYLDIGTPSDYLDTSLLVARREGHDTSAGARAHVAADARVERSILWDDVVIDSGTMLRECIVTDGARVPADTSWHGVILRAARGDLAPTEKRIGDLAVSSL